MEAVKSPVTRAGLGYGAKNNFRGVAKTLLRSGGCFITVRVRFGFQSSSMVEHAAVNRGVVGSSPTSGANFKTRNLLRVFFKGRHFVRDTVSGSVSKK